MLAKKLVQSMDLNDKTIYITNTDMSPGQNRCLI